mgnify:CR=1 FL=1
MANKKDIKKDYMIDNFKLREAVETFERLRKEKEEILKLASSKNPPENLLDRMNKNEQEFKQLLKQSEQLKQETLKHSTEIKKKKK